MADHVLLIDDDPEQCRSIRTTLETSGDYRVTAAFGKDALLLLEGDRPDLVILDAKMPGRGGMGLLMETLTSGIPILVTSEEAAISATSAHPGWTLLQRPIAPARLLAEVHSAIGGVRKTGAPSFKREASGNGLLAALARDVANRLDSHLERVPLSQGERLLKPDAADGSVYFPVTGKVSLVRPLSHGGAVEVAMIGREGVVGGYDELGLEGLPGEAIVQIGGWALRLPAAALRQEAERHPSLRHLLLRHHQALFMQVAQSAVCQAEHGIEKRVARWLLMASDPVESGGITLSHESIAGLLARRRAGVTVSLGKLKRAGIVQYKHRRIWIVNRDALARAACECYRVVKEEYRRLGLA